MSKYQKAFDYIRKFYDDDLYETLPRSMMDEDYISFLVSASGIHSDVAKSLEVPIAVAPKSETAYTDGKTIFIGIPFFVPDFYEKMFNITDPYEQVLASICLFNGFLMHEGAHIGRPSEFDFNVIMADMFPDVGEEEMRYNKLAANIANIVEDVHVEHYINRTDKYTDFVKLKNNFFLFPAERFIEVQERYKNDPTIENAVNLIAFMKNRNYKPMNFGTLADAVEMANEVVVPDADFASYTPVKRTKVARLVWDEILEVVKQDKEEKEKQNGASDQQAQQNAKEQMQQELQQSQRGEDEQQEGSGGNGGSPDLNSAIQQAMQEATEGMSEEEMEAFASEIENKNEEKIKRDLQRVDNNQEPQVKTKPDSKWQQITSYETDDGTDVFVTDVMNYNISGTKNNVRKEFRGFADTLKIFRGRRNERYTQNDDGDEIMEDELEQWFVDRRIMGLMTSPKRKRSHPEAIILVDISGSTVTEINDEYTLKQDMLEIGWNIFNDMNEAGMSVSFYTHSTGTPPVTPEGYKSSGGSGYSKCLITAIAATNMPFIIPNQIFTTSDNDVRFKKAHDLPSSGNVDGYALRKMGKYFTPLATSKLLIHLSDGSPAGSPSGLTPDQHVKRNVQEMRDEGVLVLSFSTIKEVVDNNNMLYGKDYNIAAYGANLSRELQRVVATLARHG